MDAKNQQDRAKMVEEAVGRMCRLGRRKWRYCIRCNIEQYGVWKMPGVAVC